MPKEFVAAELHQGSFRPTFMGHFESPAALRFVESSEDVAQLRDIHMQVGGRKPGRRYIDVLNRSAIVLLCAVWEAYCEDLADDALRHLLNHSPEYRNLPEVLQKRVARELRGDKNELSPWKLAGDGWKAYIGERLNVLKRRRDFEWNSPKPDNVDKLFEEIVGIPNVTNAWRWKRVGVKVAKERLNRIVTLRGEIAHRGSPAGYVRKKTVTQALNHIGYLVALTDAKVTGDLKKITGLDPWTARRKKPARRPRKTTLLPKVLLIAPDDDEIAVSGFMPQFRAGISGSVGR